MLDAVRSSRRFREVYEISSEGNFEGLNHLIRKNNDRIDDIEEKLLAIRQKAQPAVARRQDTERPQCPDGCSA
ncbi:MAG: hypothetical protein MZV63_55130 [Marinilabiliales bacterium]|nr:hypothetical protein [Marinilabiliales bacterium]